MSEIAIPVPDSLMLDPSLPPSAKLVWMALRLSFDSEAAPVPRLMERTALARETVVNGLSRLAAAGWYPECRRQRAGEVDGACGGASVSMPASLLADPKVGIQGRLLYGYLQLVSDFQHPTGHVTYTDLISMTCASPHPVRRGIRELVESGWVQITQRNRLAPIAFTLRNARAARNMLEVERVQRRLERATFRGEALMREYLSLLVDSDHFEDDAAPGFLVNPMTEERMQLDRFYPPAVAFEYNGPQHYGATELYSRGEAAKQRARDLMKLGICVSRGITLVTIHAQDLSLQGIREKIGHLLPLRDLCGREHLLAYLEGVARRYRLAARRRGLATATGSP